MGRVTARTSLTDDSGQTAKSDLLAGYAATDLDENSGGTSYYGFLDAIGNWYIMKKVDTSPTSTLSFVKGTVNYATNWTGRGAQTYDVFANVF